MEQSWVWWHAPVIPVTVGNIKWEDHSPGGPGQKARPISRTITAKTANSSSSTAPA
jgi:hypothetical protein